MLAIWQLDHDPAAVGEARHALCGWLAGLTGADPDDAHGPLFDCIILAADELTANAVEHGKPPVLLSARVDFTASPMPEIVITVTDGGGTDVAPLASVDDSERGRGLAIVADLADSWEVSAHWHATQVKAKFLAPDLPIPAQRHELRNAPPVPVEGGTRTGLAPVASLSALI
jgi:anti-sigma regulatory factor (Ser/Thr protein kinase)